MTECHRLRHVPLKELSSEDLRLLIGQEIGLPFLVPLALEQFAENPWTEGHMYPGDLLKAVVTVSPIPCPVFPDHLSIAQHGSTIQVPCSEVGSM